MANNRSETEKTAMQEILGSSAIIKSIEFFIMWKSTDFTITDLSDYSNVGRTKVYEVIETLLKNGIIKTTRKVGVSKFYQIDKDNPISKDLIRLYRTLFDIQLNKF